MKDREKTSGIDAAQVWCWNVPIEETTYYKWLSLGGYNDIFMQEVVNFMKLFGMIDSKQRRLAKLAHDYYFHRVERKKLDCKCHLCTVDKENN